MGTLAEVCAPASALRWGGWLKHYCRHVAGPDLSLGFALLKPTRALAWALNGDSVARLSDYALAVAAATDDAEIRRLQRESARLLIRATMVLRADDDEDWPQSLADLVAAATQRHPKQGPVWAYFGAQAESPRADQATFLAHLQAYIVWLQNVL